MKKQILPYRGKQTYGGKWVVGSYVDDYVYDCNEEPAPVIFCEAFYDGDEWIDDNYDIVDPATIGQCTGKKDKNGKLIFEGDIVKIVILQNGSIIASGAAPVVWHSESFGVTWGHSNEFTRFDGFTSTTFEIIGNIHDNPELLKPQT